MKRFLKALHRPNAGALQRPQRSEELSHNGITHHRTTFVGEVIAECIQLPNISPRANGYFG